VPSIVGHLGVRAATGALVMTQDDVSGNGREVRFAGLSADLSGRSDNRPPLVLLHGLTFDRTMWGAALTELSRVDPERQTLLLDLPGHGKSDPCPSYAMDDVVENVHGAIEEAGLAAPVIVGHSLAAIVATIYATRHPTSGIVNVDQSLRTQQFSEFLRSMAEQLRGPAFPAIWGGFVASMHLEVLPSEAQELLRATTTPDQDLVLGYWHDVLTRTPEEMNTMAETSQAILRTEGVPYMIVAGDEVDADYRAWLLEQIPQTTIKVLSGSGHFPHLAHPESFARCLAETAHWPLVA
jgi:pimeloyl-ACP methyl ester carboxylesterase